MRIHGKRSIRVERRRDLDRAWLRYVRDGFLAPDVDPEIQASWRRTRDLYGIDPGLRRPRQTVAPDVLAERRSADEVLALAAPVLRDFAARLARTGHVLAWLDGEGVMLSIDGDLRVVDAVQEIGFAAGTSWAEASAGTNGPGTALAEARPVEVFASEHFVEAWQRWSCAAAPVLAPGQERPVGLVDITGPWEVQRRQAILIAKAIAGTVEERLRAVASVREEVIRYAFRAARAAGDALVAVDARGRVLALNDAAARRRVLEGGALPPALRDALAGGLRGGAREVRLELPDGPGFVAAPVEYEGRAVGAILRLQDGGRSRPAGVRARSAARYELGSILGRSEPLLRAVALARSAAATDLPVILTGETGTGKELFAHAIHAEGARVGGPFVAVNCGAIPATLVEAELFGYEPGTFTGARREGSAGKFEDADGGTLFLDEVSELPPAAQTALLRVLQEGEVVRLGGSAPRPVDVRVVAATNRPLDREVAGGRFRSDLLFRLNVLRVEVPPLRVRGDDVELLAGVFLAEAEQLVGRRGLSLDDRARDVLRRYGWPGNVRELRNVILRAAASAVAPRICAEDLGLEGATAPETASSTPTASQPPPPTATPTPPPTATPTSAPTPAPTKLRDAVRDSERDVLRGALEACGWNYAKAAQRLGISRMTLYRRLERCGISRSRPSGG
jgi:transcriptional regulator of acetoin/glycerol metabolism